MQPLLHVVWASAVYLDAATSLWMRLTRNLHLAEKSSTREIGGKEFHEGDAISIDGTTGNIYDGIIPTVDATIAGEFGRIMDWADKYRRTGLTSTEL